MIFFSFQVMETPFIKALFHICSVHIKNDNHVGNVYIYVPHVLIVFVEVSMFGRIFYGMDWTQIKVELFLFITKTLYYNLVFLKELFCRFA